MAVSAADVQLFGKESCAFIRYWPIFSWLDLRCATVFGHGGCCYRKGDVEVKGQRG